MPVRNVLFLILATAGCLAAWIAKERDRRGHRLNEVLSYVEAAYIEPIGGEPLFGAAVDGIVSRLDENSAFVSGGEQRQLEAALDQQFAGVGLEVELAPEGGDLTVVAPVVGGPAWRAGIVPGERVVGIDGAATRGMSLDEAVRLLRGPPGTAVAVRLLPPAAAGTAADAGASRELRLERELVGVESVQGDRRRPDGSWDWWLEDEPGIALVRINGFGERTVAEFDAALAAVEAAAVAESGGRPRGVVIDLRGNPGGLLAPAVEICDRLLDEGVIVSTRGRDPDADVRRATPGAALAGVPLAVLIDGLTASSAEIVAACLQDHGRAVVVGSRSYGKGTVQSILPLSAGGLLKITTSEYRRPSGAPIHRRPGDEAAAVWGVVPDAGGEVVPSGRALERLRRWRRVRDLPLAADAPPAAVGDERPRDVDEVLARGLERLADPSQGRGDLGREEEAAGHADEAAARGA
jgi:carboxyl-terminal processing protease